MTRFATQIRRAKLEPFLRSMVRTLRLASVPTADEDRVLDALPGGRAWEPAPAPDGSNWRLRCIGTTLHAFSAQRHRGVTAAAKVAANAYAYYRTPLRLSASPPATGERRPFELNAWTCVRLIPLDLAESLLPEGTLPGGDGVPHRRTDARRHTRR